MSLQYKPIKTAYVIMFDVTAHALTNTRYVWSFIHSYIVHFRIRRTTLVFFFFFRGFSSFLSPHPALPYFVDFTDNMWSCNLGIAPETIV